MTWSSRGRELAVHAHGPQTTNMVAIDAPTTHPEETSHNGNGTVGISDSCGTPSRHPQRVLGARPFVDGQRDPIHGKRRTS